MRTLCLAVAALAIMGSSSVAGERASAPGVVWSPQGAVLTRVDAVTRLALPEERKVLLGYARYALSASPDGALLAATSGMDRNVHISDLDDLGRTWTIGPLPDRGGSAFWIGRRTLAVGTGGAITVLDVEGHRSPRQIPARGIVIGEAAVAGRYVALLAPDGHLGVLHLLSVTPSGAVRTIALPSLRGGRALRPGRGVRSARPGLALSPSGNVAYVVGRGTRIVAASFDIGRARVIRLRADRTLQAASKLQDGWERTARLLGTGTLVSTGGEYADYRRGKPAGIRISDLGARRTRIAMPGADQFRICGNAIVGARSAAEPGAPGVVALDRKGRPLWSQYAGAAAFLAGCSPAYVYLQVPGSGVATLDARTGAVLEARRGSAATVIVAA
jgi:hypothetical protein